MKKNYTVWIEAEEWKPGEWDPENDNTDVCVTFADGSRWIATFFTYSNIGKLVEKYRRTGECNHGKYFWATDMILVDRVSRDRIEEIIQYLIDHEEFENVFSRV